MEGRTLIEQLRQRNERFERWMYSNGHPNRLARVLNRCWAVAGRIGIWRSRLVTLEVAGRSSGRAISFPLVVVREGGERYLVAMLGDRAQWVRNVRAAGGGAAIWDGGRRQQVVLEEIDPAERGPLVKRYAELAPGGRSFIPVDLRAGESEFAAIARQFPVFRVRSRAQAPEPKAAEPKAAEKPAKRRRRRWRRWAIGSLVALVVVVAIVFASVGAYLQSSATPALALPASVSAPTGPLDGAWAAGDGSLAGFRIDQTVLGMTGNVAGRTNDVTGTATISDDQVTAATFRIDLTTVRSNGKPVEQFDRTLQTQAYPEALFTLTRPIGFDGGFVSGGTFAATAIGNLAMHGQTRLVSARLTVRRDGAAIDVAGSIPVPFAEWGIRTPGGVGWLGALADHGDAEFLLILQRA